MRVRLHAVWPIVRLDSLAEVRTGLAKNEKVVRGAATRPYLRVANVQAGHLDLTEVKRIAVAEGEIDRYALRDGDVLMTEGGDFDKLGRGTIWRGEIPGCLHQNHVFAVRTNRARLLPEFLALLAESDHGRQYFLRSSKQSTNLASINSTQLRSFPVPAAPLAEQSSIVAVHGLLIAMESSTATLAAAKRRLKRALLQQLLTVGRRGRVATLGDVVRLKSGNTPSKERPDYWGGDFPWISAKDLKRARIGESIDRITALAVKESATVVPPGTVVILVRGMTLLKNVPVALTTRDLAINQDLKGLVPTDEVDPAFLMAALAAKRAQLMGFVNRAGHGTGKLDTDRLLSLPIRLPSLPDQRRISACVDSVDHEITLLDRQLTAYRQLKRGLMQQLLTGDLATPAELSAVVEPSRRRASR